MRAVIFIQKNLQENFDVNYPKNLNYKGKLKVLGHKTLYFCRKFCYYGTKVRFEGDI